MNSLIAGLLTTVVLAGGATTHAAYHQLPVDPADPVITMDFTGSRLQRVNDAPTLSILADGSVVMPQVYEHSTAYESRITMDELQSLLTFIIDENRFFEFDSEAVAAKVKNERRRPLPIHISTTVISITADHRTKEISFRGLGHGPSIKETEGLLAIRQRLNQLTSMVKLGGPDEVEKLLAVANAELGSNVPDAQPLTADDLHSGGRRSDGSLSVWFMRRDAEAVTNVTIDVSADGERFVTAAQEVL